MKTLFDPCPGGWRVPQSGGEAESIWHSFAPESGTWSYLDQRAGYLWSSPAVLGGDGWFPASGYRLIGANWISGCTLWIHIRSSNLRTFRISRTEFTPDSPNSRAHGYSVRCIRE